MKKPWIRVRKLAKDCEHNHLRIHNEMLGRKLFFCSDCRCFLYGRGVDMRFVGYVSRLGGEERAAELLGVDPTTIRNWRIGRFPLPVWMQSELVNQRALAQAARQ